MDFKFDHLAVNESMFTEQRINSEHKIDIGWQWPIAIQYLCHEL